MTGHFPILVRVAWRNVRRQARRSALTAAAMVVGLALLVMARALADGGHEDWIDAGVRMASGHLTVQAPGFQRSRSLDDRLSSPSRAHIQSVLEDSAMVPYVATVAPRVEVTGMANSPAGAIPIVVAGVDPLAEHAFSELDTKLVDGRYLEPGDRLRAYVGRGLMERLDLRLNSRVVLTAQDVDGEIAGQLVRVVGVFRTGMPEVDQSLVHIPLDLAQAWLGLGGGVSRLAVMLHSSRDLEPALTTMRAVLAANGEEVVVLGWRDAMPELETAVRMDDESGYLFLVIIFIIVALAIVNTVFMSVLFRIREFGVLRALGLTKQQTGFIVFTEGMILTVVGGVIGLLAGLAGTWLLFRNGLDFSFAFEHDISAAGVVFEPVIYPAFRLAMIGQSLGWVISIGILSSLYPAIRAAKIDVAEAMKFEA